MSYRRRYRVARGGETMVMKMSVALARKWQARMRMWRRGAYVNINM